jgi:hypothetical protein
MIIKHVVLKLVIVFTLLLLPFQSYAGRTIDSVTLSPNPAIIDDTITVTISVTGTGSNNNRRWRSTSYSIDGGSEVCVDTDDYQSTSSQTDSFDISGITSVVGSYDIEFIAYRNTDCGGDDSDDYSTTLTVTSSISDITLSPDTIFDTDASEGEVIGNLTPLDSTSTVTSDSISLHTWDGGTDSGSCSAGTTDNWRFAITNNVLSIDNASGSTLPVGSYTICVKTDGLEFRKSLTITVTESLNADATYLDEFNDQSYDNNDGELDWSSDWEEYDDDDSPTSGDIQIEDNRLHLVDGDSFIYREIDLSIYTEANLSFDYELNTNGSDDDVYIVIRTENASSWTIIYTLEGGGDEQDSVSSFDITAYISDDTDIGIYTADGFDRNDDVYIDNFAINASGVTEPEEHLYFDQFTQVSYGNDDGELDWVGDWDESGDDDNPSSGDITIESGELKITDSEVSITREVNLEGYSSATLSFSYHSVTSFSDDIVYLQIRKDNGSWVTLQEFVGSSSSNDSGDVSIDISSYIDEDVDVRFLTDALFEGSDEFYVDDFAIDATIAGSCPDISSYDLIFHDDFSESVYDLEDTWESYDFDRDTISVWENGTIYTLSSEELDIVFEIDNGTLQIAGDVTSLGNSEYGVLLHDVDSEGYSSSTISEYSIETSISAFADEIGNNDVGIVFGYQDENDFYLLRWAKLGVGYANDTTFPGIYRNLDLVWVKDGVPTVLVSEQDFYSDDPMSVQITVDADGISICINGNDMMSYASAQPNMYSVGLFSYDNDYDDGLQVHDFKVYCHECEKNDDNDIIGWWPMEDSLEDVIGVNDLSAIGNINFGSSNIAKTVGENSTCKYAIMDGESYGQVDDSGHLNSEELAVSAWVYPTSYPNDANDTNGSGTLMAISSKDENYEFHINANGRLYWWWQNENSTSRSLTSTNTVPLNAWSHVAISYQAGEQKMYINGVLENSSSWNEIPKQSTCDYYVGADVGTPNAGETCEVIPARTFIGELDEVRIYGRYLSESEIEADMNLLRACGLVSEVDHYRITHPQNNLSCAATSVTVEACNDESCTDAPVVDITGYLDYTLGGNTSNLSALSLTGSTQDIDFDYTSLDTITLGLNNMSLSADVECFYNDGTASSCDITYNQFGYIVTTEDITSSETISDSNNKVSVQAVEAIENNPAVCEAALVGEQSVNIDFTYVDHPTGYDAEQLNISLDDSSYTAVTSGSGTDQTLDFNNTDAMAYFYVRYGDAGTLKLSVSDPSGDVVTGYDSFNVIPNSIKLVMDDGAYTLGSTGNETHYAGQEFNLTIQALNADGNVTNNYRPGSLELKPVMSSPLISSGANAVSFYYGGSSPISFENTEVWETSTSLVFDNDGYTSTVAQFDNVGSFSVDVKDSNYLGYEINSDSATSAGRFTPAYFIFEDSPDTTINDTHTTFTYIGESLEFVITPIPEFTYVAKTYTNLTATNYVFVPSSFGFISSSYEEDTGYSPDPYPSDGITSTDLSEDGEMEFTLDAPFLYEKSATPLEPVVSTISLIFSSDELKDADNIGYDSNGINNDLPIYQESFTAFNNTFNLRYGRLFLENAFGDENSDLKVEMVLQYYEGGRFITNIDDSETQFASFIVDITENELATSYLSRIDGSIFTSGKTAADEGLFIEAPNTIAELLVEITNLPNYLNVDWDGDGLIDTNDKVSSTVIFGSYRGNDRIIYKRER